MPGFRLLGHPRQGLFMESQGWKALPGMVKKKGEDSGNRSEARLDPSLAGKP